MASDKEYYGDLLDDKRKECELLEEKVDNLSEYVAKNEIKDMTQLMKSEYSVEAFLDMFEAWLRVSSRSA